MRLERGAAVKTWIETSVFASALGIGEDQIEAACAAGDLRGVAGEQPDPGRPGVLGGERRGRGVDLDGDDFDVAPVLQAGTGNSSPMTCSTGCHPPPWERSVR
jgi:hypothetical protein